MDDNPANMPESAASQKLRLAEARPLPVESDHPARVPSSEVPAAGEASPSRHAVRATPPKVDGQARSIHWRPIVVALVILFAAGAGLWRWHTTPPKPVAVESPLDYHKREFLAALRGGGSNAPPMQLRADRMRFHQRALLSLGFLEERRFTLPKGRRIDSHLGIGRLEGVDHQFAMVEPRGNNVLVVIAPREDMPLWETLIGKPNQR